MTLMMIALSSQLAVAERGTCELRAPDLAATSTAPGAGRSWRSSSSRPADLTAPNGLQCRESTHAPNTSNASPSFVCVCACPRSQSNKLWSVDRRTCDDGGGIDFGLRHARKTHTHARRSSGPMLPVMRSVVKNSLQVTLLSYLPHGAYHALPTPRSCITRPACTPATRASMSDRLGRCASQAQPGT
jgi:hypothetical protein